MRSRVSFSTGWMSDGSGPAPDMAAIIGCPDGRRADQYGVRRAGAMAVRRYGASCARDRGPHLPSGRSRSSSGTGRRLPSTNGDGPTFSVRSPRAAAHALRAPGQLGLGRAYVSGELEVDDIDAVIDLLDSWQPPALEGADKRALLLGAVRAAGDRQAAAPPPGRAAPQRPPPQQGARRPRRPPPLRRLQRVLRALPRRVDDLQLRDLLAAAPRRSRRPRRRSSRLVCPQAGAEGGRPRARRRLRLGQLPALGGDQARRQRRRHHPLRRPRPRRPGSGPRRPASPTGSRSASWTTATSPASASTRSPASAWSSTSAPPRSTSTRRPWRGCWSPAGGCSTTASPASATPTPRPARSRSATSSPTRAPLHLSRNLLALERAGFVTHHVEDFGADYAETLRHWSRNLDENLDEAIRLAGPERVRVWRLYLRAARNGFESGFTSIYQARCTPRLKPGSRRPRWAAPSRRPPRSAARPSSCRWRRRPP